MVAVTTDRSTRSRVHDTIRFQMPHAKTLTNTHHLVLTCL